MLWRFTIIDRNGKKTVIDEPNGWQDFSAKLKRHPQRHGTFREIQGNNFQFFGTGAFIIQKEYKANGPKGEMQLLIEQKVPRGWWNFYQGIFSFPSYDSSYEPGTGFYVTCDVDQSGPVVDLINRFEQSVDITKNKCFNGVSDLASYPFLNIDLTLPSKAIFSRAEAVTSNVDDTEYSLLYDDKSELFLVVNSQTLGFIVPKFDKTTLDEIKTFRPSLQFDYVEPSVNVSTPDYEKIENYEILKITPESLLVRDNVYDISLKIKGTFLVNYGSTIFGVSSITYTLKFFLKYGVSKTDLFIPIVIDTFTDQVGGSTVHTRSVDIDYSFNGSVTLKREDKIWPLFELETYNTGDGISPWKDLIISFTNESYFKISSATKADPTSSKVWMINEAASRVIESITDNRLKLYSEYFGRNNSAPYSFSANGCGSQRILTNGLQIRNVRLADGSIPSVFLSMKDLFESLAATDNIGMGTEGENLIRIENWKWFYKNNVIHRCLNVNKINRSAQENEIYSTFKCGYDKWESEDYNGLDEFLTKREFRLDIPQVKNTLEQICKFITSGYASEVTRRKGNTSTDWRYDNNIFMICVEPEGGSYKVELNNILNPANVVDPPTIYNFRLSPMRNAMRWFDRVIGSYRNVNTGHKLIFASADGNYVAEGELTAGACKLESGVIKENQDLSLSSFADQADALPIMWPERVKFSYPLGANEYRNIQNNPYGLIEFTSPCDNGFGWIDEINYKPNEGLADFTLIPKID